MNYNEALEYLNGLIRFGIKLDLDRFKELCYRCGNPQDRLKAIHITGTNGKGSTTIFLATILRSAGYKVGAYLSPNVFDVRERILINGEMIPKDDFAKLITEIVPHVEAIAKTDYGHPTEFEVKTIVAFLYFLQENVDFAVLEVGIGGRFDATNVVNPLVSIITNVSLDHTDRLGNTIPEIAFEKAGIIKEGRPVVTGVDDEAWPVILHAAEEKKSAIYRVCECDALGDVYENCAANHTAVRLEDGSLGATIRTPYKVRENLSLGMRGRFQHSNAALAVMAADLLVEQGIDITEDAIIKGLRSAFIPGRLEILRKDPIVVIDGAHNAAGAAQLAGSLAEEFYYRKLILVVGMLKTHSFEGLLARLAPMAAMLIATEPNWPLAANAEDIAKYASDYCKVVTIVRPVKEAIKSALSYAQRDDLICVTGSFYTIGEVDREWIALL